MSHADEVAAGLNAKVEYEGSLRDAIDNVRCGIISRWATSPIADIDGQHELRLMLKVLDDVERNILKVIDDGTMAKAIMAQQEKEGVRR
jgi:hypothetical protein